MLGELDREAVERTAVQPGHVALDDVASPQSQPLDLSQRLRVDRRQEFHAEEPRRRLLERERAGGE